MPVTGFEVLGAVSASYGLIDKAYNSLVHLRECWKHSKDVEGKLGELVKLAEEIKKVVKEIEAKVNSRPNELETSASGIIGVLQSKVDKSVEGATTALQKLDKYQESTAGPSSGLAKFHRQVRTSRIGLTVKMKFSNSITDALAKAELSLDKALLGASNIEMHRKLDEAIWLPQTKEEEFVPYFDRPELPPNLVLDFGSTETQEGRLLQRLLGLQGEENVDGISAVGSSRGSAVHGMGGIGKTTALRALCYHEKVRKAFPDGIYFFELGQDAKDSNVRNQLEQCVYDFGGVKVVAKMEKESTLDEVVKHAARWVREKAVLFVCDDLWRSATNSFGYLPLLKRLLRNAPRSKLLISTRDQRIAEEVSMSYETFGTLPPQGQSARNLLGQIAFGDEHVEIQKRTDIQEYAETILKVCAGLQLALCMAGRTLRTAIERLGDIREVFENYSGQLERDQRPHDKGRSAQLYDHGLPHIVEASLVQCEQWAEKSLNSVNVRDLFCSLCVLEKQMVMPKSMLSNLWGISAQDTDHVVQKFSDLGLISETMYKTPAETTQNETTEDVGVRLHDLILVLCQEMAGDLQERHGSVIDALKRSKSVWIGEKIPGVDEWWCLKNDGYIYSNLSRHIVSCGRWRALANLLCDVRWTLRRVKVGGWLALKMDFERLFAGSDYAEVADIGRLYEVLKRHWSEVSRDGQFLTYYIVGSLTREERKNMYPAQYIDSMTRYLSRPFLVPRSKFLGPEDSREVSLLTCSSNSHIDSMDFSRSADIAVVGAEDQISVWSASAQKKVYSFTASHWPIPGMYMLSSVAISANGGLIVSGHRNGTFKRWNAESGEPVGVPVKAHKGEVTCLAISKDGLTIVTGSKDKTLHSWKAENGEPKCTRMRHEDVVRSVAICDSESMIVSGSWDGSVRRWNIDTGAMIGEPLRGHEGWVSCVSVDENGEMIVSGSTDKTLLRWDAKSGEQIGEPMRGHSDIVMCVAIGPCGKTIASACRDGVLRMWDTNTGEQLSKPFRGHTRSILSVRFRQESGMVISGSYDGTIRRWRTVPSTQISKSVQKCEDCVSNIVFNDNGQKVVTSCTNAILRQWDANSGELIGKPMKGRREGDVVCIVVNEQCGMTLAVYNTFRGSEAIKIEFIRWSTSTCEMTGDPIVVEQEHFVTCAALSSNGKMIVTGSYDGMLQRYCAVSGVAIGEAMHGHKDSVKCVAFSGNDELIVSGSDDGSLIRWATAGGEQIGEPLMHNSRIDCISISDDGTVIVSCSFMDGLCRWNAISGEMVGQSVSKQWYGYEIWTNDDCTKIVIWTGKQGITWWSVASGGAILETSKVALSGDVRACAIDMNRGVAAVGLSNGAVSICDIHE